MKRERRTAPSSTRRDRSLGRHEFYGSEGFESGRGLSQITCVTRLASPRLLFFSTESDCETRRVVEFGNFIIVRDTRSNVKIDQCFLERKERDDRFRR